MPDFLQAAPLPELAAIVAAFFLSLTVINVLYGFILEKLLPKRRIFDVPLAPGQLRFELIGNLVFLAVAITTFTTTLASNLIHFGPASLTRNSLTFLALMYGFQIFYYGLHRAMHHKSLVRFHRWHHRSHVTTPLSAQSMSFVESCAWMLGYIGIPLLFSYITPIGFWGWIAYIGFNVSGNIVGHANVEMKLSAFGVRYTTLAAGAPMYHALHHARWTGHYGFQAVAMDRIFNTEWQDWPTLFQRIIKGQPLKNLKERA